MPSTPFVIVGNWKSNKTIDEAIHWFQDFSVLWTKQPIVTEQIKIILCPAFIHLTQLTSFIDSHHLPIALGAQDVSPYESGTYTGGISAEMLKRLVSYSLVGHSERRQHFHEQEAELIKKVERLRKAGIEPIYCVQKPDQEIPQGCNLVAYEPVWAISRGDPYATKPESAENANQIASQLKQKYGTNLKIIYGGSTNPDNVASYVKQEFLDGILPGGASLKADTFYHLIRNASGN